MKTWIQRALVVFALALPAAADAATEMGSTSISDDCCPGCPCCP